jgi:hypothetical protein
MDDEKLFEMLEECIAHAVSLLEKNEPLHPFAMTLEADDTAQHLHAQESDPEKRYLALLEALKAEAKGGKIKAAVLLARVTIPEDFNPEVPEGLRLHVEERASASKKLAARFLYVPYRLYRQEGDTKISVHLHHPIPVGFPSEIFI